jgi:putative NADH-flavin reductase
MQITVFGASGKVGSLVVAEALRRGYRVVAFVHSHNLFSESANLIVQRGDIYNAQDVSKAIRGSEVVISCLGSWGLKRKDVLTQFVQKVVPAMEVQKITRIVTLTGAGVRVHPSKLLTRMLRLTQWLPIGKIFADGQTHVQLLSQSHLGWTTICSPVMNNWGNAAYHLGTKLGFPLTTVSRSSVAAALLDQVERGEGLRQALVIHRG